MSQTHIDAFYKKHGPCCAGCDHWRWVNSITGECIRSAPAPAQERIAMLGMVATTHPVGSGHVMTKRDHLCGEFKDTYDWSKT